MTEFLNAIKNPLTRDHYQRHLAPFFDFLKLEGPSNERARAFVTQAKHDNQWATYQINEYLRMQKLRAEKKEISESTLANYWKPVKLLCEESDIILNWRRIMRRIPKGLSYAEDTIPTTEEIRTLCSYPDPRIKSAVLIMESAGCRIGAFDTLDYGHIEPIKKGRELVAAKIILYPGTTDKYYSFLTPEAFRAIEEYITHRREAGERITESSPLFRDLILGFDRWGKGQPHKPVRLKASGIKRLIEDGLKIMGLRNKLAEGKRRYDFSSCHSLRKVFKTACERKMKSLYVEILMGHRLGVSQSYVRPKEEDILTDYMKAVNDLTIFEKQIESSSEDVETLKAKNFEMEKRLGAQDEKLERVSEQLEKLTEIVKEIRIQAKS